MAEAESAMEEASIGGTLPDIEDFPQEQLTAMEKEMLGVYLTSNPLNEYTELIKKISTVTCDEIAEAADGTSSVGSQIRDGMSVTIAGIINNKKTLITKSNKMMAFVDMEDLWGNIEVIIFPNIYKRCRNLINEDQIVVIKGTLNFREEETPKLLADSVININEINSGTLSRDTQNDNDAVSRKNDREKTAASYIQQTDGERNTEAWKQQVIKLRITGDRLQETLSYIRYLMGEHRGNIPVVLYLDGKNQGLRAERDLWVDGSEEFRQKVQQVLGEENVKF